MGRILLFMLVAGLFMIPGGLQRTYESAVHRTPHAVSLEQFEAEKPTGGWYQVKDCLVSPIEGLAESTKDGEITKVYIPVYKTTELLSQDKKGSGNFGGEDDLEKKGHNNE